MLIIAKVNGVEVTLNADNFTLNDFINYSKISNFEIIEYKEV